MLDLKVYSAAAVSSGIFGFALSLQQAITEDTPVGLGLTIAAVVTAIAATYKVTRLLTKLEKRLDDRDKERGNDEG